MTFIVNKDANGTKILADTTMHLDDRLSETGSVPIYRKMRVYKSRLGWNALCSRCEWFDLTECQSEAMIRANIHARICPFWVKPNSKTHVFLVAFQLDANNLGSDGAQRNLIYYLEKAKLPEYISWWVAEDNRLDNSDNDSAVFCPKGGQDRAANTLDIEFR